MKGRVYPNKGKYGAPWIVKFPGVFKRFKNLEAAEQLLSTLRYKYGKGTFDRRDYQKDNPLGFENLSNAWLDRQKSKKSFGHMKKHIAYAQEFFANQNIKEIGFGALDDFFFKLPAYLGNKTKDNIKGTLHAFWVWVSDREGIQIPKFPKIKFVLKWRKITDKPTQAAIVDEIRRISYDHNPKYWLYTLMLTTYPKVRPIELLQVREEDVDLDNGLITITWNKVADQYKRIRLLPEDIETIRAMPKGFPKSHFFRHPDTAPGKYRGKQIARKRFEKWWDRACHNLGVKGVSLYPGTRHSTVNALGEIYGPDRVKDLTGHTTDKAFGRYFGTHAGLEIEMCKVARNVVVEMDDVRGIYGGMPPETNLKPQNGQVKKVK